MLPVEGHKNLFRDEHTNAIINTDDLALNDGRPDKFVSANSFGRFSDYQFTADDLQQFTGFTIKIVMLSTNECSPVRLRDLRILALA